MSDPTLAPIASLARPSKTEPAFLSPHHVEAAHHIRRLFERSHLRKRVTMHYGPRGGASMPLGAADISDMAADARKRLNDLIEAMPRECGQIVLDVCCFEKGLQDIERDRNWPRRSAKLILRMALDVVAARLGLSPMAVGPAGSASRFWLGQAGRPTDFS